MRRQSIFDDVLSVVCFLYNETPVYVLGRTFGVCVRVGVFIHVPHEGYCGRFGCLLPVV